MIAVAGYDNWVGLSLAALAVVYLVLVLDLSGALLMSWQAIMQVARPGGCLARGRPAAGPVHGRRLRGPQGRLGAG